MCQQHPLVAEKILNWVMRLDQWHPPVAEKILNWLQDCTSRINRLLKRSWIGLQDCVPAASSSCSKDTQLSSKTVLGGTADLMDVARYREITITTTTTSDKNTHYHSPSSCLLLAAFVQAMSGSRSALWSTDAMISFKAHHKNGDIKHAYTATNRIRTMPLV